MEKLFLCILNMSLMASVTIAAVLAVRLFLCRAPRIFSYLLWAVVLFRLVCPVSFSSEASLIGWLGIPQLAGEERQGGLPESGQQGPMDHHGGYRVDGPENPVPGQETGMGPSGVMPQPLEGTPGRAETAGAFAPGREPVRPGSGVLRLGAFFWLAGMAAMLGSGAFHSRHFYKRLKSGGFSTPFVYGIVRPHIYLPEGLGEAEREYILLHERIHIRRGDQIWRMLGFLALCVHWFNPLVWIAFFLSGKDMEMSCDEAVIRRLGSGRIREYSESLLALAVGRPILNGAPLAFGEGDTGGRIRNLLRYKKPVAAAVAAAAVVCIVAAVALLADPVEKDGQAGEMGETAESVFAGTQGQEIPGHQESNGETNKGSEVSGEVNREVYSQIEAEGSTYLAYYDGIFRADGADETCVWEGYMAADTRLIYFEGRLYWIADLNYAEGGLDWVPNGIAWVDLQNGRSGGIPLAEFACKSTYDGFLLTSVDIRDGFISISGQYGPDLAGAECRLPMSAQGYLGMEPADMGDGELENYGLQLSAYLRQNPGTMANVSIRRVDDTYAVLDLDGDGQVEKVHLCPGLDLVGRVGEGFDQYSLMIGGTFLSGAAENLTNNLFAVSLDGEEILLVLLEEGPSGDPRTMFFRCEAGELQECGSIGADIRYSMGHNTGWIKPPDIEVYQITENGLIYVWERIGVFQTDSALFTYRMNDDHRLEREEQEYYGLTGKQPYKETVTLLEELPVCETPGGDFKINLTPGTVFFTKIAFGEEGESSWIYVEGYNGAGWMEIEGYSHVAALDKEGVEVFEGLSFAG